MNIKTIKLKDGGFKGATVEYLIDEVKGGRLSHTPVIKKPQDPIHKDLENLFKGLRKNILDICQISANVDDDQLKFLIMETEVTGIEFDSDGFIVHGRKEVIGNKCVTLNTPKIEEIDGYADYESVQDVIKDIITETKLYLGGEKKVSDEELTERWLAAGKEKGMSMEQFNGLPLDEQRDFATSLLENRFGSIVMHSSDTVSEQDIVVDAGQVFTIGEHDNEAIIPVGETKSKKDKKPKKEVVVETISIDNSQEEEAF